MAIGDIFYRRIKPGTYPSTWYWADTSITAKTVSEAADRYKALMPNVVQSDVGGMSLALASQATLDLSLEALWDTVSGTDYRTASNRAGKDFYIYLCQPGSGTTPTIKVSANATYPSGYSANTSRKVGGFHCLCVAAGTISGHPATGYVAGDIIPNSVWDLKNYASSYPKNGNVGMAYIDRLDEWYGIYLPSGTGTSTASVYNGTITDTRMWNDHVDDLAAVGCYLPTDSGFQIAAEGSNQQTNINGNSDPVTTGGHSDSAGRRMISNFFLEDMCGAMWQWLQDQSYQLGSGSAGWKDMFPDADKGQLYLMADNADIKLIAGGSWGNGASCGSRSRFANAYRWSVATAIAGRAVSRAIHK